MPATYCLTLALVGVCVNRIGNGSDNHCSVNRVRSIRPSARSARDRRLPAPAAASLRRMTDGTTAPFSIEALSRMSSVHCPLIAAVSTASPINGASSGQVPGFGELALGPKGFREYDGHFWGFLETRPYMRARGGLALALLKLGEEEQAMEHFRVMLKLNPGDNQGIRYLLLGSLLRRDDIPALKTLLADYADEWSAYWLYTRALVAYREGQGSTSATVKLLKDARSANEHVPAILVDAKPPMPSRSDYVTVGGADEAANYVRECGAAWRKTPGAVEWLTTAIAGVGQTKRRASKAAH